MMNRNLKGNQKNSKSLSGYRGTWALQRRSRVCKTVMYCNPVGLNNDSKADSEA